MLITRAEPESHKTSLVRAGHMGDRIIVLGIDHALQPLPGKAVKIRFISTMINLQHPFIDK